MNIRIRLMNEGEENEVNEVYNIAYGDIRPLSFFQWEFLNGPWGRAIYVIAEDLDKVGNKIIGTQCAIPIILVNQKGQEILTAKSEDTFVDPNYRGQKLFEKMYDLLFDECKKKGIMYLWGFTYAQKPFLKIGFEIPFDSIQAVRIQKISVAYRYLSSLNPQNRTKDRLKIFVLCLFGFIWRLINDFSQVKKSLVNYSKDIVWPKIISEQTDEFWEIKQTETYIQWRFETNPYNNRYGLYFHEEDFYSIVNNRPERIAYLEELKFKPSNKSDINRKFISSMLFENSRIHSPALYRYWGFNTNSLNIKEIDILKNAGFIFIPSKGTSFVWKSLAPESLISAKNIHLSRVFTQGNR